MKQFYIYYAQSPELCISVCRVLWYALHDLCLMNSVEDKKISYILAASSRTAYIYYTKVGKMSKRHRVVLLLLTNLGLDAPASDTMGNMLANDSHLYILSENDSFFMIQSADVVAKNEQQPVPFTQLSSTGTNTKECS